MGKERVDAVWFWLWSSRAGGPSVAALMKRALQLRSLQPFLRSAHFLLASPLIRPHLSALSKPPNPPRSLSFLHAANVIHGLCCSRDLLRQRKQGIFTDQSDGVELCYYCTLTVTRQSLQGRKAATLTCAQAGFLAMKVSTQKQLSSVQTL